jgi:hypothetical protein
MIGLVGLPSAGDGVVKLDGEFQNADSSGFDSGVIRELSDGVG